MKQIPAWLIVPVLILGVGATFGFSWLRSATITTTNTIYDNALTAGYLQGLKEGKDIGVRNTIELSNAKVKDYIDRNKVAMDCKENPKSADYFLKLQ